MRWPTKQRQASDRGLTNELELQSPRRWVNSGTIGSPASSHVRVRQGRRSVTGTVEPSSAAFTVAGMNRLVAVLASAVLLATGLSSTATADAFSYRSCGKVIDHGHTVPVKAGKHTSCLFARRATKRVILRQSCYPFPKAVRSPVNGRVYYIECLGIERPARPRRTIFIYGGKGDHGTVLRVRAIVRGWVN